MSSESTNGEPVTQETGHAQTTQSRSPDPRSTPSLPKDAAFHLLQNSRRRALLRYLFEKQQDTFRVREAARRIAAWEDGVTVQQLCDEQYHRVSIALRQNHLPKLAEHAVIEYRQSAGEFSPQPRAAVLEPLVGDELATSETYLEAPSHTTDANQGCWSGRAVQRLFSR